MTYIYKIIIFLGLFLFSSISNFSYAQEAKETAFVKIEIGYMGLHCPFLGTSLKDKIRNDSLFGQIHIDNNDKFITFSFPINAGLIEKDFEKMAVETGYSADIVKVTLSNSEFPIDEN